MTFKNHIRFKDVAFMRAGLFVVLLGSAAIIAPSAFAQSADGQQLPSDVVDQQVPSAFPSINGDEQAQSVVAGQKSQAEGKVVDESAVPLAPTEKKLVPARAMGVGVSDQAEAPAQQAIEDAPAMPDILEKYAAKAKAGAEDSGSLEGDMGDALPVANSDAPPIGRIDSGFSATSGTGEAEMTPQKKEALKEEIRTEAFDAALTGVFPLTEEQIALLLKRYDSIQKVTETPPYQLPTPEISVQNISLDPGIVPPTIKTAVGNVTTLNILDATGAPWPVQDVTWAGDYEVVEPEEGGHIIRITPLNHFARGNIVIRLLALKTPLTLTLETGRDVVQYRVDARVPEYGPFAAAPLMQGGKSMVAGNSDLTAVLDGSMSAGMVKLDVVGVDGRTTAYSLNGLTYVRTPLTLLSPAWKSSISSADGTNVYELSNAPVLLLSDGGSFTRATLKEKEDLLDE